MARERILATCVNDVVPKLNDRLRVDDELSRFS